MKKLALTLLASAVMTGSAFAADDSFTAGSTVAVYNSTNQCTLNDGTVQETSSGATLATMVRTIAFPDAVCSTASTVQVLSDNDFMLENPGVNTNDAFEDQITYTANLEWANSGAGTQTYTNGAPAGAGLVVSQANVGQLSVTMTNYTPVDGTKPLLGGAFSDVITVEITAN